MQAGDRVRDLSLSIRVLSVKDAAERRMLITETLNESRALRHNKFDFFLAVGHDEAGLRYDDIEALTASGRTLSPAECSCYASHYRICVEFLQDTQSDFLLVIEDDIYIDPYFDVKSVIEMMNLAKMDYLRLFCRAHVPGKSVIYEGKYQIVRFNWSPGGTQAYLLSRAGAKNLVDHIERSRTIRRPIDIEMDRCWDVGNAVYALYPQPILEFNLPTTIHSREQIEKRVSMNNQLMKEKKPISIKNKFLLKVAAFKEKFARKSADRKFSDRDKEISIKIRAYLRSGHFSGFQVADD